MNKKIIITGANGFVGQNLISYLSTKSFVISKLSLRNKIENLNFDANAVIHLAGKAHDTKDETHESEYFKVNTDLTKEIYKKFLDSNIETFIYFSSVKAVADKVEGVLVESDNANPITPYGKSKLLAEQFLLSQTLPPNKRLIILRPCMIHGPGNKGNLNLLYSFVKKGIPYPLGSFQNERSFLFIENLNFIIESILTNINFKSGIYNLADDEYVSTNDLVKLIASGLNKKSKIWNINKKLIVIIAKMGNLFKLPINTERVQKLTENYRVSNKKIKLELGVTKLPVSTKEGLLRTINDFNDN